MPNGGKRKRMLSLKIWQRILSLLLILATIALIVRTAQEEKPCCLCNSFRYHAPCLFDLETGKMIELDLYFPHHTLVAELAEKQPEMCTFSFVRIGNVSGTKLTGSKTIEIHIPNDKHSILRCAASAESSSPLAIFAGISLPTSTVRKKRCLYP